MWEFKRSIRDIVKGGLTVESVGKIDKLPKNYYDFLSNHQVGNSQVVEYFRGEQYSLHAYYDGSIMVLDNRTEDILGYTGMRPAPTFHFGPDTYNAYIRQNLIDEQARKFNMTGLVEMMVKEPLLTIEEANSLLLRTFGIEVEDAS